jgi:malate dehydrogenase (oxaloacetate-decarboxylating)
LTSNFYYRISECNNALIYPGLGFGAILSQSRCLSDTMLFAGAERLAELSPAITRAAEHISDSDEGGRSVSRAYEYEGESIMPDFENAPQINFEIAVTVAVQAVMEGSARAEWAKGLANEQDVERAVREKAGEAVWVPVYYDYEFNEGGLKEV